MSTAHELLEQQDLVITAPVPKFLKCTICKRLLVKACFTPCGCRFCRRCLDEHLQTGRNAFCPGDKDDCKEVLLSQLDVQADDVADRKVMGLIANCPHQFCSFTCEVRQMSDHVRMCDKATVKCAFFEFGCQSESSSTDRARIHMQDEAGGHARMLAAFVRNMDNEMKLRLEDMDRRLVNIDQSFGDRLKLTEANCEVKLDSLRADIMRKFDGIEKSIVQRDEAVNRCTDDILSLFEQQKLSCTSDKNAQERMRGKLQALEEQVKQFRNEFSTRFKTIEQSIPSNYNYTWRIERLSQFYKNRQWMVSPPFYTCDKGYQMRLRMSLSEYNGLYLCFYFMRGSNDDRLVWPSPPVTLTIVNQDTDKPEFSERFSFVCSSWKDAYQRPQDKDNLWGDGFFNFKTYQQLANVKGVIKNDCLVVVCSTAF